MTAYIVSYDLNTQGQKYKCLTDKLEAYGTYWHAQGSVWIIISSQTATQVRDNLKSCLDSNDELFVGKLSGEAAWFGYSSQISDWLKKNL